MPKWTIGIPLEADDQRLRVFRADEKTFQSAVLAGRNIQLMGPPRLGKTSAWHALSRELRTIEGVRVVRLEVPRGLPDEEAAVSSLLGRVFVDEQHSDVPVPAGESPAFPSDALSRALRTGLAAWRAGGARLVVCVDDVQFLRVIGTERAEEQAWRRRVQAALLGTVAEFARASGGTCPFVVLSYCPLDRLDGSPAGPPEWLARMHAESSLPRTLYDFEAEHDPLFAAALESNTWTLGSATALVAAIRQRVNGHPHFTQLLCSEADLLNDSDLEGGGVGPWLDAQILRLSGQKGRADPVLSAAAEALGTLPERTQASALDLWHRLLTKSAWTASQDAPWSPIAADDREAVEELVALGMLARQRDQIRIRNRLYQTFFDAVWTGQQLEALRRPCQRRALEWVAGGARAAELPPARLATEALRWLEGRKDAELTSAEIRLRDGLQKRSARRRAAILAGALALVAMVLGGLAYRAEIARRDAEAQRQEAETQRGRADEQAAAARRAQAEAERERQRAQAAGAALQSELNAIRAGTNLGDFQRLQQQLTQGRTGIGGLLDAVAVSSPADRQRLADVRAAIERLGRIDHDIQDSVERIFQREIDTRRQLGREIDQRDQRLAAAGVAAEAAAVQAQREIDQRDRDLAAARAAAQAAAEQAQRDLEAARAAASAAAVQARREIDQRDRDLAAAREAAEQAQRDLAAAREAAEQAQRDLAAARAAAQTPAANPAPAAPSQVDP